MFLVKSNLINVNSVYFQEDKYGKITHKKEHIGFLWTEKINIFLDTCGAEIDSFITDCINDRYEDLDELEIGYLYKLGFPSSNILLNNYPVLLCAFNTLMVARVVSSAFKNLYSQK